MEQIPAELQSLVWEVGGAFGVATAVLLVALPFLLPRGKRWLVRWPLAWFVIYLGVVGLSYAAWMMETQVLWLRVAAIALVLFVLTRTSLLLATETWLGKAILPPLPRIFIDVVQGLMLLFVLLLTLYAAGLKPGELLATSAVLTVVLGLALQDTLGNLFSGLALQVGQHFQVGDWIEIDSTTPAGRVLEIGWRATRLVTLDETEIIVPNSVIAKSVVRNHTRPSSIERRNIAFGAPYGVAPGRIEEVVLPALSAVPRVLVSPPPSIITVSFADSAIQYVLRYYTDDYRGSQITDALVRNRIWYALTRAGIAMPFPQRDLHLRVDGAPDRKTADATAQAARVEALRRVPIFDVMSEPSRVRIAGASQERLFTAGEEIVREGDAGQELFVLVQGRVAVFANGEEVARLEPGGFFGEMSLLTGEPRSATVVALGDVRAIAVAPDALRPELDGDTDVVHRLGTILAERQVALEELAQNRRHTPLGMQERAGKLLERIRAFFPR
jgi:small-conductance mechanosensitive channel/CRP-like cAMP-binding protein